MRIKNKLALLGCGLAFTFAGTASYANNINMYDQPAANAKIVGSLNSERGIINIFTPKGSAWTKVADPQNGNVGWVKTSDIGNSTFNFKVITGGTGAHQYRIYQYGNWAPQTPTEIESGIKLMQLRQQMIQRDMQHMMNDMFSMAYAPAPVFVPVMISPHQHGTQRAESSATQSTKPAQVVDKDAKDTRH